MDRSAAPRPIVLAAAYLAGIFALAFCLGVLRSLWLAPRIGALAAVACELPLVLAASAWWARRLLARRPLQGRADALAMGALAFAGLIALECGLALFVFGQSLRDWGGALTTPPGLLGLAGQLGFAAMPAAVWQRADA